MTDHPRREDIELWKRLAQNGDFESLYDCDSPVLRLIALIEDMESAINWDTTCFNCSHLLDKLYAADAKLAEKCPGPHLVQAPPDETDW